MKTLAVLLFVFIASVSGSCYDADWWSLLDKTTDTWATCDLNKKAKYIRGFWRSANGGPSDERVGRLEEARCCCPAVAYTATADADCMDANWWTSLDKNNHWSTCPAGHYLSGLFKTGVGKWLHNIEEGKCCKPKGHPADWGECYDADVGISFDNKGWSECNADFYLVGLYRGGGDLLQNIEKFKCCKMADRKYRTPRPFFFVEHDPSVEHCLMSCDAAQIGV